MRSTWPLENCTPWSISHPHNSVVPWSHGSCRQCLTGCGHAQPSLVPKHGSPSRGAHIYLSCMSTPEEPRHTSWSSAAKRRYLTTLWRDCSQSHWPMVHSNCQHGRPFSPSSHNHGYMYYADGGWPRLLPNIRITLQLRWRTLGLCGIHYHSDAFMTKELSSLECLFKWCYNTME